MYQTSDGARAFDIQIDAAAASRGGAEPDGSILFPDKDVLFTATFKRSGTDLILEGPDATAVVLGYFKGERRAGLTTPEGAGLKGETIEALAGPDPPARYAQASGAGSAEAAIGRVEKVAGTVTVLRNGVQMELRFGDPVAKGDVVQTGPDSSLTIKLNDGTVFNLSSSARMVLNDMVYAANSNGNTALFTLIQGLIGFVAGQVAKTGDMKVDTPVATMAIRGTAVQTEIVAVSGTTRFSLLTEPDGRVGSILLLDKSNATRVIASMSDARVATLLTPIAGSDPQVTRIAKTNDELRSESDFTRDLFQFFSSEPRQRRGSSDSDDAPIVPVKLPQPLDGPDPSHFAFVPFIPKSFQPAKLVLPVLPAAPEPISGTAVEDGPVERLIALPDDPASGLGHSPRVLLPETLPPGVRYDATSQSFALNPAHPAYQHLGAGETETVTVDYRLVLDDGAAVPVSVTWTVKGTNDAPVAKNDRVADLDEGGPTVLTLLRNDRDVDGDPLHVVSWTSPLEGSLRLDANGNLVFDPGDDFRALSRGEHATVSFTYTVADGHGGTDAASATLNVRGSGTFSPPDQAATDVEILGFNHQPALLTIEAPAATTAAKADIEVLVSLGEVVQPQMNILYLIDVSGSTSDRFDGTPVGDLNADGRANTVLDAEIASLLALTEKVRGLGFSPADVTITIIPFNESADPTDARDPRRDGLSAATFGLDQAQGGAIENYLRNLDAGGETNFADALRAANERLQGLDQGNEDNILYFLSDGQGQGAVDPEIAVLNDRYGAAIVAIGMGENASLSQLSRIDNTGGASRLTSPDQIDVSAVGSPLESGVVADLDLFVNGVEVAGIGPEDLVTTPNGLVLRTSVGGLGRIVGDDNDVSAIVTFESGEVLAAGLNIPGALPLSTDFVL